MSSLWIAEYERLAKAVIGGAQAQIAPLDSLITVQQVTISGTSAQSAALSARTRYVRLYADAQCAVLAGASPTAAAGTSVVMAASAPEYMECAGGLKIAAITV